MYRVVLVNDRLKRQFTHANCNWYWSNWIFIQFNEIVWADKSHSTNIAQYYSSCTNTRVQSALKPETQVSMERYILRYLTHTEMHDKTSMSWTVNDFLVGIFFSMHVISIGFNKSIDQKNIPEQYGPIEQLKFTFCRFSRREWGFYKL